MRWIYMAFNYTNFRGDTYHLYKRITKKGNPSYYFAKSSKGDPVDTFPSGYEIYEEPNGKVYIRRKQKLQFTEEEIQAVQEGMKKYCQITDYKLDVKDNFIYIYTVIPSKDTVSTQLLEILGGKDIPSVKNYDTDMRFELIDPDERIFSVHRFCFLGSVDDWIELEDSTDLSYLVKEYVVHLGQDSFFDLI